MNLILRKRSPYLLSSRQLNASFGGLLDTMLKELLTAPGNTVRDEGNYSPHIEVRENDQSYFIEADLPGVTKDNLKVSVEGQRITIEADVHRESLSKEGESIIHTERVASKYTRSIEVTNDIDDSLTVARLENGVLILNLPKKQASQSRLITIQ